MEGWLEKEMPPAAFAGDGLGDALLLSFQGQASLPARGLWVLIRGAEIDAWARLAGAEIGLAVGRMALNEVEHWGEGGVKVCASATSLGDF